MSAAQPVEQRIHSRFVVGNHRYARVRFGDGPFYPIRDLSFSGFSIQTQTTLIGDQIEFYIFDRSVTTTVNLVHHTDEIYGYQFQHRTPTMLIFLRPFLECLRYGSTIRRISEEHLKDEFQDGNWIIMNGDGPTDLAVKMEEGKDRVESMLLTFLDDAHYRELRYKKGKFHTGRQIDKQGVATRMSSDAILDLTALRYGLTILSGIEDAGVAKLLLPLVLQGSDLLAATSG